MTGGRPLLMKAMVRSVIVKKAIGDAAADKIVVLKTSQEAARAAPSVGVLIPSLLHQPKRRLLKLPRLAAVGARTRPSQHGCQEETHDHQLQLQNLERLLPAQLMFRQLFLILMLQLLPTQSHWPLERFLRIRHTFLRLLLLRLLLLLLLRLLLWPHLPLDVDADVDVAQDAEEKQICLPG